MSPLFTIVAERAICWTPRLRHLFTVDPSDPSPSGGRSGGGRVGGPRLTAVDKVVEGGAAAGDALEKEGLSVLLPVQVGVFSDSGASWSSVVAHRHACHPRIGGSATCVVPRPDPEWCRIWDMKKKKVADGVDLVDGGGDAGRRLSRAEWRRLPVRAGDPSVPSLREGGAAARRRDVLVFVYGIGVRRALVVIFSLLWTVL
jgi:hypothetical protein